MALFGLIGRPPLARWKRRGRADKLRKALSHRDPSVRQEAARLLGEIGDLQAAPDLLRALAEWEEAEVVLEALEAMGWTPGADSSGALFHAKRADWEAVGAVGPAAIPVLLPYLQGDTLEPVSEVLESLGWTPEPTARGARWCIARGRWEQAASLGAPAVEPLVSSLETTVFREDAIAALVEVGEPAVSDLVAALRHERSWVRQAAARALGQLQATRAVRSLCAVLEDPDSDARRAAAKALGEIGDRRATAHLRAALTGGVGPMAAEALGRIGGPKAIAALASSIEQGQPSVRMASVKALGHSRDPRAAPILLPLLRDRLSAVRMHAALALGRIGTRSAVEELALSLADDTDVDVRCACARALGQIGDPKAIPALSAATTSFFHEWVRRDAALALAELGTRPGLDEATKHLLRQQAEVLEMLGVRLEEI